MPHLRTPQLLRAWRVLLNSRFLKILDTSNSIQHMSWWSGITIVSKLQVKQPQVVHEHSCIRKLCTRTLHQQNVVRLQVSMSCVNYIITHSSTSTRWIKPVSDIELVHLSEGDHHLFKQYQECIQLIWPRTDLNAYLNSPRVKFMRFHTLYADAVQITTIAAEIHTSSQ